MVQAFKFNWCDPAVGRVPADSVVVNLNKLKDLLMHVMACSDGLAEDGLLLKRGKEAFGYRVIPTISFSAHTL